jgi:hypothetical protein
MEVLIIKGAPTFNTLLNPTPYGAAINPGIQNPSVPPPVARTQEVNFNEAETASKKRPSPTDRLVDDFERRQKLIRQAVPTLDNSEEWTACYKKIKTAMEEKVWEEKILKDWGGKFPDLERLDLETLREVEAKVWSIISMSHPFEAQWELMKIGAYGAEKMAMMYGLTKYKGVTEKLANDRVLYLEAKKYSLQHFDFGSSMGWFNILTRIYKDISEVAETNSQRLEMAESILKLPVSDEVLELLKRNV